MGPRGLAILISLAATTAIAGQAGNAPLIPAQAMQLRSGANAAEVAWFEVGAASRKRLAFDHGELLEAAVARLRSKVEYTSLPAFLLEEPFTLPSMLRAADCLLRRLAMTRSR